jgi:hypothetical protein
VVSQSGHIIENLHIGSLESEMWSNGGSDISDQCGMRELWRVGCATIGRGVELSLAGVSASVVLVGGVNGARGIREWRNETNEIEIGEKDMTILGDGVNSHTIVTSSSGSSGNSC